MAKKKKNLKKQNVKKVQKQKKRREKLKKQSPPQQARSDLSLVERVDHALELLENGDLRSGKRTLETLEKKHADHPALQFGLGVVAAKEERYPEAASHFEKAVEIEPDFVEAQFNLAYAYKMQSKIPEMVQALREVIKRDRPGTYQVVQAKKMLDSLENILKDDGISLDDYLKRNYYFEQGIKRMDSGELEGALRSFHRGVDIDPDHPQSYGNMGICYASLGKKQQALDAFDRALELDPNYEPAHLNRALVTGMKEGEIPEKKLKSVNYYTDYPEGEGELLRNFLEEHDILNESEPAKQSTAERNRGTKKKRLQIFQYSITDEPIPEPRYDRLPEDVKDRLDELMVDAQENPIRAIPELQKFKGKYPGVPSIYNYLAAAYSNAGDMKRAEAVIEENLAKHPDYLFAKLNYAQLCIAKEEYEKIPEIFDNKFELKMLCPEREKFHITEFATFFGIMGAYFFFTGKIDEARRYNKYLQEIAPETLSAGDLNHLLNSK